MIGVVVRAAALTSIYLLVLTSFTWGDVLVGAVIGLGLALALRPRRPSRGLRDSLALTLAIAETLARTAVETVIGSWRVVRFCLGGPSSPGFVEVQREDRNRHELAFWGLLTGEAPDEVVVDIDPIRGVMLVHMVDADDAEHVRERHRLGQERWRRRVAR